MGITIDRKPKEDIYEGTIVRLTATHEPAHKERHYKERRYIWDNHCLGHWLEDMKTPRTFEKNCYKIKTPRETGDDTVEALWLASDISPATYQIEVTVSATIETTEPISRASIAKIKDIDDTNDWQQCGGVWWRALHWTKDGTFECKEEGEFGNNSKRYHLYDKKKDLWILQDDAETFHAEEVARDMAEIRVQPRPVGAGDTVAVSSQRRAMNVPRDAGLWAVIRKSTSNSLAFVDYCKFIDMVLCRPPGAREPRDTPEQLGMAAQGARRLDDGLLQRRCLPYSDTDAYRVLKVATEAFIIVNFAVPLGGSLADHWFELADFERIRRSVTFDVDLQRLWNDYLMQVNGAIDSTIPYLALVQRNLGETNVKTQIFRYPRRGPEENPILENERCMGILRDKLTRPCLLELIWSYWHEEGMLVQTLNAIARRFQNVRNPGKTDPLRNLETDTLRPLNNLLWGYIQDEQHRLTVRRRAYEYDHHYGISLYGKATQGIRPADSRSRFLEPFHTLLHLCTVFFQQEDDTTVIADGFPLLNALKDVHHVLSEGAHNQFGDLPSTARQEMLIEQWLLARPEFREFLPSRPAVAYPEAWMSRVDAMKDLQGWTDTSVIHFHDLGVFGEQILLSIRYGSWSEVIDPEQAAFWARYWRAEIQGYIYAYRAATGIDLTNPDTVDARTPSVHLRNRLIEQKQAKLVAKP